MKKAIGILIILSFIGCNTKDDYSYQQPIELNDQLNVSTLKRHNLDTVKFNKLNKDIYDGKYGNIHSLLIMKDNELIVEQYYGEGKREQLHFSASVTKGFVAILTGIAMDKGYIDSLNHPMLEYFPKYSAKETDIRKHKVTIEHLLTMSSGFKWDESTLPFTDPNNDGVRMDKMDNWLDASLTLKMDTIPGTKYVYCGPNDIILGEIIKLTSGKNIADFAKENLFAPLKINDFKWDSKNGIFDTGGGLWLKSRDLIKFGQLLLNEGKIGDEIVVSKYWIDKTFTPYFEIEKPFYMGYQWRNTHSDEGLLSYFISGNGGQVLSIVPDLNMVFVITADNREEPHPLKELVESILRIHPDYESKTTLKKNRFQ